MEVYTSNHIGGASPTYILPDDPPKTDILLDIKTEPADSPFGDGPSAVEMSGKVKREPTPEDHLDIGTLSEVNSELVSEVKTESAGPDTSRSTSSTTDDPLCATPGLEMEDPEMSIEVKEEVIGVAPSSQTPGGPPGLGSEDSSHCASDHQHYKCAQVTGEGNISRHGRYRCEDGSSTSDGNQGMGSDGGHSGLKRFLCDDCGKSFDRRVDLDRHRATHSGEKNYRCDDCGKSFARRDYLVCHRRTHKPYACADCGKVFTRRQDLVVHGRTHSGEKPYVCHDCGKSFARRKCLVCHRQTHSAHKSYVCAECGKSFAQQQAFVVHGRTHSAEKPYTCGDCGKSFSQSNNLARHRRIRSAHKPYVCSRCGKLFTDRGDLVRHERIHSGQKPYVCGRCGKSFNDRGNLVRHERTHSGEKPYPCGDCGKSFVRRDELARHRRTHSAH